MSDDEVTRDKDDLSAPVEPAELRVSGRGVCGVEVSEGPVARIAGEPGTAHGAGAAVSSTGSSAVSARAPSSLPANASDDAVPELEELPPGRTALAERLDRLKQATFRTVTRRERLPQPLFWSLFHSEVREIKRKKDELRLARKAFLGGSGD